MCTVTWLRTPCGYDIFFNRDERKTRKPALPPAIHAVNGVRYVAPSDGDAGGSWIATNEFGVTLGLLNHYPAYADDQSVGWISRGLLLTSLMDVSSAAEVAGRLENAPLAEYRPFFLVAFDATAPATIHTWDGRSIVSYAVPDEQIPVTTSSFDSAAVIAQRKERLAEMRRRHGRVDAELLREFHASRETRGDAYSVFMQRDDAETVSISHVTVTAGSVEFAYVPRAAVQENRPHESPLVLARA